MHRLLKTTLLAGLFTACASGGVQRADYQVIPLPQQIADAQGADFRLDKNVKILYPADNEALKRNAEFLAEYVGQMTGLTLQTAPGTAAEAQGNIVLATGLAAENPEAYRLRVTAEGVIIEGVMGYGVS